MKLSLRQLQIFCAIARSGSTTNAAIEVHLSQSATSAALNELENALGTRLFDRVGKRLVLNDNGSSLLPRARKMLETRAISKPVFIRITPVPKRTCASVVARPSGNHVLPLGQLRQSAPLLRCRYGQQHGHCPQSGRL